MKSGTALQAELVHGIYCFRRLVIFRVGLPEGKKIMVLAPHPDDEVLGCGGTLALMNKGGAQSTVVFLTSGERLHQAPSQAVAEERKKEARKASELLRCEEPLFFNFPDGEIAKFTAEIAGELSSLLEKNRPDILLVPSPIDYHQDHRAAAKIALEVCPCFDQTALLFYEIYSTVRFNLLADISEVAEEKNRAILAYRTSLYGRPEVYARAVLGLNAHRSLFVQTEGTYEAFYLVQKDDNLERILASFAYVDRPA